MVQPQIKRVAIAYFIGTYEDWGGASRALLNLVRCLDKKQFRPVVIVTKRGELTTELDRREIEWRVWPIHDRGANLVRYAGDILRAVRFFQRDSLHVLHINYGSIGWKPAEILAARLLRIPVVEHLHLTSERPSSFMRYSSAVVAVSQYVADHSESMGAPKIVVRNTSDIERFGGGVGLRRELGYSAGDVVITFIGQLIRAKGLDMFVDVVTNITDQRAKFVIAGRLRNTADAYTKAEVQALVARDPRINYLGHRTDIENLYATSDIIVMPSQWSEPCGLVLLEAAAAGKPVVATATGGIPEILRHEETGFLVERTDVQGMARYVAQLINEPDLRASMGRNAAELARGSLTTDPLRRLEDLYISLAKRKPLSELALGADSV